MLKVTLKNRLSYGIFRHNAVKNKCNNKLQKNICCKILGWYMVWYNVFHKSFLYLSLRFQLRCVLVLEEKIAGQAIILHTALTFTYLVLVGRKRTQTTVRKE